MTRLITEDGDEVVGFVGGDWQHYAVVRHGNRLRTESIAELRLKDIQDLVEEATQALEEREAAWNQIPEESVIGDINTARMRDADGERS